MKKTAKDIMNTKLVTVEPTMSLLEVRDCLVRNKQELIVIEAKKSALDKGFNQLAAELIALDKYEDDSDGILYGAVTIGEMWGFCTLDRKEKNHKRYT